MSVSIAGLQGIKQTIRKGVKHMINTNIDDRDVANVRGMKTVLEQKFKDENCCFTKQDITIKRYKKGYQIIIKDYECIPFYLFFDYDEYFKYSVFIKDESENDIIIFTDSKECYKVKNALIQLGYYIASRF